MYYKKQELDSGFNVRQSNEYIILKIDFSANVKTVAL